jgi:outer membrane receptor protein involved in Fe transport
MRQAFIVFLLLLGGVGRASHAQTAPQAGLGQVQGVVLDSAARPLREVSVSLLQARDSSYVTFALTDGSGHYTLRNVRPGKYLLLVNALGYKTLQQPVNVPTVELLPLRLRAEARQLGEVVVTHERPPVSVNGDTVAFSAKAFKTQPNAAVEQLLKKLPGVEVDRDGTIRSQGQTVNKVLVDGKPFFGDDPKMATRNLPADIIEKVQLYDQQDDQANFSGIDRGDRQRTINLVTRRDKRKGYFGTEQAGLGTAGRYQTKLGLNRYNNGRQISALVQADNVNRQGFSDSGGPSIGSGEGVGGDASSLGSSNGGFVLGAPGGPRNGGSTSGSGNQVGITESASGGLNYRNAWGKRLEVAGSYLATRATTRNDQQAQRQNLTGTTLDAVPLTDRRAASRARTTSQRANLRLDYQLDSLTSLRLTPNLSWQTTDQLRTADQQTTQAGILLNQSTSRYDAQAHGLAGSGNALLMRKFKRVGRTFSANANLSLDWQSGLALNQSTNTFFTAGVGLPQVLDQRIDQATPRQQAAVNLSYTEPFSLRHQLEAHYSYTTAPSQARRLTTDYNAATGQYELYNALLSNDFTSHYAAQRAGLTWQTRRLRYTYNLGLDAQQAALSLDNQAAETSLRRAYPTLLPQANFSYSGARSRSLRLNYRTTLTAPAASQLQPVPDNSNPLSIRLGNSDLRPEYGHNVTATYNQSDWAGGRSVLALLVGQAVQHRIVSATTFDAAGVRTTQPVNVNGYVALDGYLSLGQRLPTHQLNLNASTSANLSRSQSFINGQPNVTRTWLLGQTLSANSVYNERLELGLNANFTYQQADYLLSPTANTAYFTQTVSGDVYWRLPGRWVLTSDAYYTNNSGLAAGYNQRVLLWNAGLAYQLFASKQGELKLYAFDLLGQNRSVLRNAADTYLEDVRSRVLSRYLLLSFSYHIQTFGK